MTGARRGGPTLDLDLPPPDDADLTTAGIGEMLPGVLPPLVWDLASHLVEEAFRRVLHDLGVLPPDLIGRHGLVHLVRGRAAMDFSRLAAMADALPGNALDQLEEQYFGSRRQGRAAAPIRARVHDARQRARHDVRVLRVRHRAAAEADLVRMATARIAELAAPPDALDDMALLARHDRIVDLAVRATTAELGVAADAAATYRRLEVLLHRHLDARAAGAWAARLTTGHGEIVVASSDASAAVFAGPTWEELGRRPPTPTATATDPAALAGELISVLSATTGWRPDGTRERLRLRAIRRLADEAAQGLERRERTKDTVLRLGGMVRALHLEAGGRLATHGLLATATDVDRLTTAELRAAIVDGVAPPATELERRGAWLAARSAEAPLPVRFRGVPAPTPHTAPAADRSGIRLEGWAAASGRVEGVAKFLRSPDEAFPPGAVLLAVATDPSWTAVMAEAAAVVLARGGPLSHAAILARELGIPAVLGIGDDVATLDGRRVTVDGDAGIVWAAPTTEAGAS